MVDETFKDVIEDELRMTYKFYVQDRKQISSNSPQNNPY
eukprot:11869.XXX_81429_80916_1 [CDS] Oithona nana genome sequencing.